MKYIIYSVIIISFCLMMTSCSGNRESQGLSQNSFRFGGEGLKFDADANDLLNLVLNNWFVDHTKDAVDYYYNGIKDKLDIGGVAVCKSSVPENFKPVGFGFKIKLLNDENEDFMENELCIRFDGYKRDDSNNVTIIFLNMGKGIIGGAWVTYKLKKTRGVWAVENCTWFDP